MTTDPLAHQITASRKRRNAPECMSPYCLNRCDGPLRMTVTQSGNTWEVCGPECLLAWVPLSLLRSRYLDEIAAVEAER